jgi:eukaryotic-like serine/threonine-protein kinase
MTKPFQPCNFGRYQLTDRIAIGGMAEIFYAKVFGAMGFEKGMVIKRILPQFAEDTDFLRMFITEAKLVCHLEHPNIVQVHELGEIDGQYYISMEFVNGIDARHLWRALAKRRQRLPGVLALFVVGEFLKGLDYAHRAVGPDGQLLGVVHRDVSPSNILISFRGDVKIGDFGIALVQQESKTQAGVLKGKFGYMSPEQVAGLNVDHRSDIFAAGIVLAELLLGRRLFLGSSDFETLDKVMNVRLDVLEEHESALPPEAVRIVRQALVRDVNDRYQSAREFYEEITEYLYQQGHRITNETLAAFMAEHVSPFLNLNRTESSSSLPRPSSDASVPQVRSPSGSHRSPVVSSSIIPGDIPAPGQGRRPSVVIEDPAPDQLTVEAQARAQQANVSASDASTDELPVLGPPAQPPQIAPQVEQPPQVEQLPIDLPLEQPPMMAPPTDPQLAMPSMSSTSEVPIDDPAFGSMPMIDIGGDEGLELDGPAEPQGQALALDVPAPEARPGSIVFDLEGAGEELDLGEGGDEEEEFYYMPPPVEESSAKYDDASVLVQGQLTAAEDAAVTDARGEPDFTGSLTSRTVAKVLFRFAVVEETGLLALTGPKASGQQAELMEWMHTIQMRANATITTKNGGSTHRTCEIHLLEGQPHLASADRSEEALLAYLIRIDELSQHRVEMAIKTNPQRRPVAALLASGSLAPLQVSRHVTAYVKENIFDTFSWSEGDFAFYREKEMDSESFPTGLEATEMVKEGVAALSDQFLDGYFAQLAAREVMANRTPPTRIERFNPDDLLLGLYRMLGTSRTVEDLVAASTELGEPLQVKQNLYLLIECELAALV